MCITSIRIGDCTKANYLLACNITGYVISLIMLKGLIYLMQIIHCSSDLRSPTGCFEHLAKSCKYLKKLFLTANR